MAKKGSSLPHEERSYKDFYPDISITKEMEICKVGNNTKDLVHQFYISEPLPAVKVDFTKPIPKPKFDIIEHVAKPCAELPPFYHHIDPTEEELQERVEYDMDEQDRLWLEGLNHRLVAAGQKECSIDYFEFLMDQFEKEWFDLVKDIPKSMQIDVEYPEDIRCAVCDDGEAENSNAIVFCDGCNVAVHQDCYGVPFIPEGEWLCRKCMLNPGTAVTCVLCPTPGGALKKTNTNKWAHLSCAMWIPECHIQNTTYMEPIEGIEAIPKSRWKLTCYICQKRHGAPIQCSCKNCFVAFHATCGKKAKLYMKMRGQGTGDTNQFRAFCDKHTPKEYREKVDVDLYLNLASKELSKTPKIVITTTSLNIKKDKKSVSKKKSVFADAKSLHVRKQVSFSTPIIPNYILTRINSVQNDKVPKKKLDLIILIAKYWALKKESMRGAALLKRLHLEPWTATASASKEEDEMKAMRFEVLAAIRKDLEKVRLLLDMVRKRERQKLRIYKTQAEILNSVLNPLQKIFSMILEKCKAFDKLKIFANPVNVEEVPDYYLYIKEPMDFMTMNEKILRNEYKSLADFEYDMGLVYENCKFYNKPETFYAKHALKLEVYFKSMLPAIRSQISNSGIDIENGKWTRCIPNWSIESFETFSNILHH